MNRITGARIKAAAGIHARKQLRNLGAKVRYAAGAATFNGSKAYATWEFNPSDNFVFDFAINYPAMPDNALVNRREADLISAYTLHEIGHVAFTDNNVMRDSSRLMFHLWNGIEDARIEHAVIVSGKANGARSSFKRLMSKFTMTVDSQGFNPTSINAAPFALALICRAALGDGNGYAKTLLDRIPEPKRALYAAAAAAMPGMPLDRSGSEVARKVAQAFLDGWLALEPDVLSKPQQVINGAAPEQQEQQDQQEQQEQQPEPGTDSPPSFDDSDDDGDQDQGGEGLTDDADDADAEDSENSSFGWDDDNAGEASDGESADSDAIADAIAEANAQGEQDDSTEADDVLLDGTGADEDTEPDYSPGGDAFQDAPEQFDESEVKAAEPNVDDLFEAIFNRTKKAVDLPPVLAGCRTEIRRWNNVEFDEQKNKRAARKYTREAALPALKAQLYRVLRAPERVGWDAGALGGRFDGKRTARMMAGSEAVFKRRWVAEGIDTVVSVLIDMSGSMKGESIKQSVDLGWTIAQAAETAGCDVEVLGFTSAFNKYGGASGWGNGLDGDLVQNNIRSRDCATLVVAKRWQDKVANCAQYFNVMKRAAQGSTPDYSAIRTVAEQLSNHRAQRKLVIVITDGCGDVPEVKALTEAAFDLYGVDVIGFGIGISPDYFKRAYAVGETVGYDLNSLHKTCLKSVADQLAKRDVRRVV